MNKNKIDFLKEALTKNNYEFKAVGDFGIEIKFSTYKVIIWETIQDTFFFKVIDNKGNKIVKKIYKSVNNLIKYGLKREY